MLNVALMLKRCLHYDTRTMYMYAVWHDVQCTCSQKLARRICTLFSTCFETCTTYMYDKCLHYDTPYVYHSVNAALLFLFFSHYFVTIIV